MRNLIYLFLLFVTFKSIAQSTGNTVGLTFYNPSLATEGYNLHFPHNQGTAYLLNNCGQIVHRWTDNQFRPGNGIWLRENGHLYATKGRNALSNSFIHAGGGGEKVEIRDWDNTILWSYTINDSTQRMHHDIELMPNGNILAIVWQYKTDAEAIAAGRNPAKLTGTGALGNGLWPEKIVELQPNLTNGTTSIVWQWNVWDHMIQDFDSTKSNYGNVAASPHKIDINYTLYDSTADWQHANSIDYNLTLDQIMLCVPTFNEIWIIDHSTTTQEAAGSTGGLVGKGGDLIYRFGNPSAYRANGSTKLFYPHDAHWVDVALPNTHPEFGKIAVFNNKVGVDYSEVHTLSPVFDTYLWEYTPLSGGGWGPSTFDWTYQANPPQEMYSTGLGAIQILPNGNRLINEGREGRAFEITQSGQMVWEYINPMRNGLPLSQYDTTLTPIVNQQFRFTKYPTTYPAFQGRDLSVKGYIELNPDTVLCSTIVAITELDQKNPEISVFPNPSSDVLHIQFESLQSSTCQLEIYDMLGRSRLVKEMNTNDTQMISVSDLENGIYILRVNNKYNKKVWIQRN